MGSCASTEFELFRMFKRTGNTCAKLFPTDFGAKKVDNRYQYSISMCLLYKKCENDCLVGGGWGSAKSWDLRWKSWGKLGPKVKML